MKKENIIIIVLSLVIISLVVFVVLLGTGKISFNKCNCSTTNEDTIDVSKLEEIGKGDFNIIKSARTKYFVVNLLSNGKVMFDVDRELTNINNAIDIAYDTEENLYILTKDGSIYKYFGGISRESSLEATKLNDYKDIKKIVEYSTRGKASGGCDYIITIDKNNNYIKLSEFSV